MLSLKKRPFKRTALPIGPLLGNLEGSFTGTFETKGNFVSGFLFFFYPEL